VVALAVLVVAGALVAAGSLSQTSRNGARLDAGATVVSPATTTHTSVAPRSPTPAPLLSAASHALIAPAEARLQVVMGQALGSAGPQVGALVYDLDARAELFALRPLVARPPASVEKLYTTAALMIKLGPNARFKTTLLGAGHLRNGVWHGDLYLQGGGDPTFGDQQFNAFWNHGFGPTPNEITSALRARGIHAVTGSLYADESLFDRRRGGLMTALNADLPDFAGELSALTYDHGTTLPHFSPATFAVHELALTMQAARIQVRAAPGAKTTPAGAQVLATVQSPPLSVMTRLMDVPSDDLFAELFTKQLGVRFGRDGSIAAGAGVISKTLATTYGLRPRILDGSGLSRSDRSSPLQIVQLLQAVWHTAVGRQLASALPTVGREGTVQGIGLKTPAAGNCIAKTGTLIAVTNLAGYCRSRDGHTLAFALMIDGPSNGQAVAIEGRLVGAIAGYDGR
jgi:D-alanyl-D-alanine carboxypeptidase/D-alanyl-D-alanine-endopeptidase (penicillin-binding protein 4)